MKNIIKFLLLAIIACGVSSCKDFLSPDLVDSVLEEDFYQTDDQINSAVTALYVPLRNSALGTNYRLQFTGFTDEDMHDDTSSNRIMDNTVTSSNSVVSAFWTGLYSALKDVAYLLEGLEKNKDVISENVYLAAKGEALFFRGYYHFLLVQWFGHPDNGLPMYIDKINSYEEAANVEMSSIDEIYEQIVADMEAAEVLLISQTWASLGYSERVTVNTVRGMLSRVSLYAAGFPNYGGAKGTEYYYKKALSKGLMLIEMGQHQLQDSYATVFTDPAQDLYNTENIWEVGYKYDGADATDTNIGGDVGIKYGIERDYTNPITGDDVYDSLLVEPERYANPMLYAKYGHGDSRRDWNYPNFTYSSVNLTKQPKTVSATLKSAMTNDQLLPSTQVWGAFTGKWRREYEARITRGESTTTTNYPLLRYSDVLLMVAEAYIELGEPTKAAEYINEVRSRAIPYTSATKIIKRVVLDESNNAHKGYGHQPELTFLTEGSGTGFEALVSYDLADGGALKIGVQSAGSGYDVVPTLETVLPSATWKANTSYSIGDYITVATTDDQGDDAFSLYKATTTGITTTIQPSHEDEDIDDDESAAYVDEQGIAWLYIDGPYASAYPAITLETGDAELADCSNYVNTSDQDAMRDYLRDERSRELCYESLRRMDLKRWGILVETIQSFEYYYYGMIDAIPAVTSVTIGASQMLNAAVAITSVHNYLPIPLTQLSLNMNLVQNPGY